VKPPATAIRRLAVVLLAVLASASASTCGGTSQVTRPAPAPSKAQEYRARACLGVRRLPGAAWDSAREGSTVALATVAGKRVAYVADEDDVAVRVIDADARKEIGATPLEGRPSQLMFLPDGRLAVLLRDASKIEVLEPGPEPGQLEMRCAVDTAAEPVGLALTVDDARILVTSGWGHSLSIFDAHDLTRLRDVPLPREPRAVVATGDGKYALVSHAVGSRASRVTLADGAVKDIPLRDDDAKLESCQGFALAKSLGPAGVVSAPMVFVDPGDPRQPASGYGSTHAGPTEVPVIAEIDVGAGEVRFTQPNAEEDRRGEQGVFLSAGLRMLRTGPRCILPRAAAHDPESDSMLVACLGMDEVIAYSALTGYRTASLRWMVGAGSSGIAVDAAKRRALVWSQFDRALSFLDLRGLTRAPLAASDAATSPPSSLELPPRPGHAVPDLVALGRLMFHRVGDHHIALDGRACASCHPDGRDDALVWSTPEGPRRSIMLAGRVADTAPYSWSGGARDLEAHLATTFVRLDAGGGPTGIELAALVAYVEALAPPPVAVPPAAARGDARIARGAELFASAEVGCTSCHSGAALTDGRRHDIGSKNAADKTAAFDTPTLRFVGGTGPYFHDGRYPTLHDLLASNHDKMGRTSKLSRDDLDALEAYLRTL
jgi:hypothetical protein